MTDNGPQPEGTPRWVKAVGIAVLVFAALLVVLALIGGHGPGRHTVAWP